MDFTQEQLDTVVKLASAFRDGSSVREAVEIVRTNLGRMGSPLAENCPDLWSAACVVLTNVDGITPVN